MMHQSWWRRAASLFIAFAFVVSCMSPVSAVQVLPGMLIKGSTTSVYYATSSGTRLAFPNEKVFKSWYSDFSGVVSVSDAALAAIPLSGNVTYHPGIRLVKIVSDPKVYAVARPAALRWLSTETVAMALYGSNWSQQVDDISDAFFTNYTVGTPIVQAGDYSPAGEVGSASIDPFLLTNDNLSTPKPVTTDIAFAIDAAGPRAPISPYIYGSNQVVKTADGKDRMPNLKLYRSGGNRFTAYNWENNASNAGIDYGPNSSDSYLGASNAPGFTLTQAVDQARSHGAASLLTIPMVDYVAADKNGVVKDVATDANLRWARNFPTKAAPLSSTPSLTDHAVYQDEFVHFMQQKYAVNGVNGNDIFYSLDNEPALWPSTHPLVHPKQTTFAEMADRTTKYATMIKQQAPGATIFGAVAYGFEEYRSLQSAPDQNGRDYLDFFLDTAKSAGVAAGHRVVDVLDLHWYPEAKGGNIRISDSNNAKPSQAEIDARVQAPRSLWDASYKEKSWITDVIGKPIALLPSLKQKIATHYPGTKLSFSEYYYGGSEHISGGIAQADVLGIFGREGIFSAALWPIGADAKSFIYGAFDMFLNYDGAGHSVGDLSLLAQTSDAARTSIYAMASGSNPSELTLVALNKTNQPLTVEATIVHGNAYSSAQAYQLTSLSSIPVLAVSPKVQDNRFRTVLPPLSVTTIILK